MRKYSICVKLKLKVYAILNEMIFDLTVTTGTYILKKKNDSNHKNIFYLINLIIKTMLNTCYNRHFNQTKKKH